jgi:hypothetical protein
LRGFWQGRVPSRAGQDVPAGAKIAVELGLDGIKQLGNVLVLVDQDGLVRFDEPGRIERTAALVARSSQSITARPRRPASSLSRVLLPTVRGPFEDHHRLLGEAGLHDLPEPSFRQAGQHFTHASNLSVWFRDSASYFPLIQAEVSASPRGCHGKFQRQVTWRAVQD